MPDPFTLSGNWDGVYTYPKRYGPTTPFVAMIAETGASFEGRILEPHLFAGGTAEARVAGYRSGRSVDFTKTYVAHAAGYENPVDYVGQLSEDGMTITGIWSMLDWNGEFEMTRERAISQEAREDAQIAL